MPESLSSIEKIPSAEQEVALDSGVELQELNEDEVLERYNEQRVAAAKELEFIKKRYTDLKAALLKAREDFGLEGMGHSPTLEDIREKLSEAEHALVEAQANYPGNWSELLRQRMLDPVTKEKFIATRNESMEHMREGYPTSAYDKEWSFKSYYEDQINNYDENLDHVMSATEYGNVADLMPGKKQTALGTGHIGETPKVFRDAQQHDGTPLTPHQKSIIEAHEQGHGLRDFRSVDNFEINSALDATKVREAIQAKAAEMATAGIKYEVSPNYLRDGREIIERMGQIKNYFGFASGSEELTLLHVSYAKEHYVADTGLDNNMTEIFAGVTPEKEEMFVEVANKYPI